MFCSGKYRGFSLNPSIYFTGDEAAVYLYVSDATLNSVVAGEFPI